MDVKADDKVASSSGAPEILPETEELDVEIGKNDSEGVQPEGKTDETRLFHLPLNRIKSIMKLDPDLNLASAEAIFAVAKATELFIESLALESFVHTAASKKRTVQKRDVDMAISSVDSLMFLEGSLNF